MTDPTARIGAAPPAQSWQKALRSPAYCALSRGSEARAFVRIMAAAECGRGVALTPEEAYALSLDHAVYEAAASALQESEP